MEDIILHQLEICQQIGLHPHETKFHSHNIFLEVSFNYGFPSSLLLFVSISSLIFRSYNKIFSYQPKDSYFERAWWASIFYFLLTQLTDIQYYDGKISLIAWILLAGLKNIIYESETSIKHIK